MSTHDTPEAVEAFAALLDMREDQRVMDPTIAAMLRRLHQRAVDAEARAGLGCDANAGLEHSVVAQGKYLFCHRCGETMAQPNLRERCRIAEAERDQLRASLTTARADALREAAECIEKHTLDYFGRPHSIAADCADAILARIHDTQEPRHD